MTSNAKLMQQGFVAARIHLEYRSGSDGPALKGEAAQTGGAIEVALRIQDKPSVRTTSVARRGVEVVEHDQAAVRSQFVQRSTPKITATSTMSSAAEIRCPKEITGCVHYQSGGSGALGATNESVKHGFDAAHGQFEYRSIEVSSTVTGSAIEISLRVQRQIAGWICAVPSHGGESVEYCFVAPGVQLEDCSATHRGAA